MRSKVVWGFLFLCGLWPARATADNRFIVRDPSGLASLQQVCATLGCTVVRGLDGNLNQLFLFRPVPGYADYRTPIKGLYLCGSAAHPGGGVMGAAGWNAARTILGKS